MKRIGNNEFMIQFYVTTSCIHLGRQFWLPCFQNDIFEMEQMKTKMSKGLEDIHYKEKLKAVMLLSFQKDD